MKVKVRIAVAVGDNGSWSASGWSGDPSGENAKGTAIDMLDEEADNWRITFVTAEVDVPDLTPQEVEGKQEVAK